jgi:hypothetical protein
MAFKLLLLTSLIMFLFLADVFAEPSNRQETLTVDPLTISIELGNKGSLGLAVKRLTDGPLIKAEMDGRIGSNINGPSLIRVPDWVEKPLGKYYLYFAAHKGKYIRLAYADRLEGPWKIYGPGSLKLEDSYFLAQPPELGEKELKMKERLDASRAPGVPSLWADATYPHIASPDIIVFDSLKEIRIYYHGLEKFGVQSSRVAVSKNGIDFTARPEIVTPESYLRVFEYKGSYYGMAMPGVFYRSKDGLTGFEKGPQLFEKDMRHSALLVLGDHLLVFWTRVSDSPEHIKLSVIDISGDWKSWKASSPVEVMRPEYPWEGADLPAGPSFRSSIDFPVNQLRDPAVFQEGGRTFLLYASAGESGIGIAKIFFKQR